MKDLITDKEGLIQRYLTKDVRVMFPDPSYNDTDSPSEYVNTREFSDCNQYTLLTEFVNVKDRVDVIVEIGVARLSTNRYEDTSTTIFLSHKRNSTLYLGIDMEDRSFLDDGAANIHTLASRSEDFTTVLAKFEALGINTIDFLFIDGWHSINQLIAELFYLQFLKEGSVVGFHDTNFHPGPSRIITHLKPELFEVHRFCEADWGIGFAKAIAK